MVETTPSVPLIADNTEVMRSIDSFEAAIQTLADAGVALVKSSDYGDGFVLLKDKTRLVGVTFVIMGCRYAEGDYGKSFVILHVVTKPGEKYIVMDGSTGVRDQTEEWAASNGRGTIVGTVVEEGLQKSSYDYCDLHGKAANVCKCGGPVTPATTFYLT